MKKPMPEAYEGFSLKPRAWITYRKKDGSGEHPGTISTNPEYVRVHRDWVWLEIPIRSTPHSQSTKEDN